MGKIYTLIIVLCISQLFARAQDSTICNAHFQTFTSSGNTVTMRALDSFSNMQHFWDFGDGTSAGFSRNLSTITHFYPYPGTFTVRHLIRDSTGGGCRDSASLQVTTDTAAYCPVSVVIAKQDSSASQNIYNFHASVYYGSGDTVRWYINNVYAGTGMSLTGQYLPAGHYTVCARLTTASGCSSSACQVIDVVNSCGIMPSFTYHADSLNAQTIHFISTADTGSYNNTWDFGDGNMSYGSHPTHTYAWYGGSYYVTLTASRRDTIQDSCYSKYSQWVYVAGRPVCNTQFTYTQNPTNPAQVTFHAQDSTGLDSLTWVISLPWDSLPMTYLHGHDPVYTFQDTGCYYIHLRTVTSAGCFSDVVQWICIDSLAGGNNLISSYPNPAPDVANLDLTMDEGNTIFIYIYNSMGHLVLTKVTPGNKGPNHISLPVAGLPKGIYYVQLRYGKVTKRSKIQKL